MKTRKNRLIGLTVRGLSRSVIYKPLAVLMAILLPPVLSWVESGVGSGTGTFQAHAQITVQGCTATGNSIIQNYCVNGVIYYNDLVQLESDAVSAYLALHNLPASDAQLIYQYGRADLREAVRGEMLTILEAIILEPASNRTPHEQSLYTWLQTLIQQNEIGEYSAALTNFNSFLNDPCHFTLDPDLAAQYKLSYDGTPFCFGGLQSSIFQPMYPSSTYFLAYGIKQSYQKPASTYANFPGLVAGTTIHESEALNDIAVAGNALAAATAVPVLQILLLNSYAAVLFFDAAAIPLAAVVNAGATVGAIAGSSGGSLAGAIYAGPVGIILLCIVSGVEAGLEIANNQQVQNDLNNVKTQLAQVQSTPPDLSSFLNDSVSVSKLNMTLVAQTLPDVPSSAALPSHQAGDENFSISPSGSGSSAVVGTLAYQDWVGNIWSAQTYGGWFVQTCSTTNTALIPCPPTDSIIASINYVDWNGVDWIASRNGNVFLSAKDAPLSTDKPCPADAQTGVTPGPNSTTGPNFINCSSYAYNSIPLTDGAGNHVTVSLTPFATPAFSGPSILAFGPSIPQTATITVTGDPTPTVCVQNSNLPADFTLNAGTCGNGSFQLVFDGAANAPQNNYSLTLQASNSVGNATQTFAINVSPQLAIISPSSMNVTAGVPASFTVVATGNPAPKLSLDPLFAPFLNGLSFQDNGNGTATISGIYNSILSGSTCSHPQTNTPCGIIATNSQGTVEQAFSINVTLPPSAQLAGCSSQSSCPGVTFYAGVSNQVLLESTGATTPVSWSISPPPSPPSWVSLHDNGNGTATLSGTPPLGTTGPSNIEIVLAATYSTFLGYFYPITVLNVPVFTSPSSAAFTVGTPGSFSIAANMGTPSLTGTLPNSLSFAASANTATISGTPAAGTGGQYQFTLSDNAGTNGTATQILTLNLYEGPQIISASTATMFVGTPGMFAVSTTGFPNVSSAPVPANAAPPTDPSQGEGMNFTVSGLPPGLQASNLNAAGFAGGTLTIQGTPTAPGTYPVQITAQNGVGSPATQKLTLNIVNITGPAPASATTCNGNYNGTFKGNITVSSGQNCAFYGGGVNGNLGVNGGHLALNNTKISGNVGIQGGSGFSIGPGTKIGGSLSIQNVGSGSTASQICESTVSGNLQILSNAIPIQIGNPQNSCYGSSFGNNVAISGNTGPVAVYDNTVGKNLSCSLNTSITGAGNSAQQKGGQCRAF